MKPQNSKSGGPHSKVTWMILLLTALLALGLKCFFSLATCADLGWILRPTVFLVEIITGLKFSYEPGTGYMNTEILVNIAKSCSGVNFLIISIGMSVFTIIPGIKSNVHKTVAFGVSLASAYLLTILTNTIRILTAIKLFSLPTGFLNLDKGESHRLAGIFIYFLCFYLFYILLTKIKPMLHWSFNHETKTRKGQ